MAYHGYIPFMKQFLARFKTPPRILEIGVDKGQTTIPLLHYLLMTQESFFFAGVDIKLYDELKVMLSNFDKKPNQLFQFFQMNSLDFLSNFPLLGIKLDLVLLDGDHNYFTVSRELAALKDHLLSSSIIICDDYAGRWAEKDLFYSEVSGYENIDVATKRQETEKHGVRAAVDEFVTKFPEWKISSLVPGEPIVLHTGDLA